ncbi:MAG: FadR family transcriptional regulator, partial [Deltaproteobacteria bacterium]|nr:FadR family transcriptional regulator [Deltaproteobacteria bacterium]
MDQVLEPLRATRLTDLFIERFEELILSGRLSIGQKLPSERELARQLAVSRPVVHDGLVELSARGLVTIQPRVGTVVNDYRREGSLALLTSLMRHADAALR